MPRFGNDITFFLEMIADFLLELPERVKAIRAAVETQDSNGMMKLAHALKGTAANFSAEPITTYAREMEMQAKAGLIQDAALWNDKIEDEIPRLQAFVNQLKQAQ
jgi:HPt (histidine-containing phosphotransfer) domain-containing protein